MPDRREKDNEYYSQRSKLNLQEHDCNVRNHGIETLVRNEVISFLRGMEVETLKEPKKNINDEFNKKKQSFSIYYIFQTFIDIFQKIL